MPVALLTAAVDLVLPRHCAGCGRPGVLLCPACRPSGPADTVPVAGIGVCAAGPYEGGLRRALIAYKERGRPDLARPLAGLLAAATRVAAAGVADGPAACLVPIPSARAAVRARGGDHVLSLARAVARATGLPLVPALGLARSVRDSAGLDQHARAANLAGAFAAAPPPAGPAARAVIVDDIVTTGATLREARRALERAGWDGPVAAVVAATARRAPAPRRSGWPGREPRASVGTT